MPAWYRPLDSCSTAARYFVDNGRNRSYEDIRREVDESLPANLRMSGVYAQQELEADYIEIIIGARGLRYRGDALHAEKIRSQARRLGIATCAGRAHTAGR